MTFRRQAFIGVAGPLAVLLLACAALSPRRPANVLIVTLDTTRADRLAPYGYMDVAMPNLDRLAAEGVVFNQAISVAPLTLPAHTSLFTGLLPPAHGVRDNGDGPLNDRYTTLAEILRSLDFRTAAFVGSVVLDPERGLAQGFDRYDGAWASGGGRGVRYSRRADEVVDGAVEWLDGIAGSPFLLWTHFFDPHRPYDPPAPFHSISDPYAGEIAFADSQIGRLIGALDARGLLDRTLIVVVGDHGESLGEHGERDHGIFVYESVLRVPLIMRAPGLTPQRITDIVRLTDIMPTILDLLDVRSTASMDGMSLVPRLRGARRALELEAYAESLYPQRFGWSPVYALRAGRFKFIEAPRPELYDLERDPFEQRNIHTERPEIARALRARLLDTRRAAADAARGPAAAVPADLLQRLDSLGYVASARSDRPAAGDLLPDAKDCIGAYNARLKAREARVAVAAGESGGDRCSSIPAGPPAR